MYIYNDKILVCYIYFLSYWKSSKIRAVLRRRNSCDAAWFVGISIWSYFCNILKKKYIYIYWGVTVRKRNVWIYFSIDWKIISLSRLSFCCCVFILTRLSLYNFFFLALFVMFIEIFRFLNTSREREREITTFSVYNERISLFVSSSRRFHEFFVLFDRFECFPMLSCCVALISII